MWTNLKRYLKWNGGKKCLDGPNNNYNYSNYSSYLNIFSKDYKNHTYKTNCQQPHM